MSRSYKIIVLLAICLVGIGLLLQQQIRQFLFHPEGLSTATAELCLTNKTDKAVIADITVENGARTVTFLTSQEVACSAAPDISLAGNIKVSEQEGEPPYCILNVAEIKNIELLKFSAPDNCDWSN